MRVHCIGIGGIGVSALAQYYLSQGWQVSGTDGVESELTRELETEGVVFSTTQDGALLTQRSAIPSSLRLRRAGSDQRSAKNDIPHTPYAIPDLVIYSPAIPSSNAELKKARELGIRCLSYPEALGELTRQRYTIAVCGTHGKSTTTAMIALVMEAGGLDPTVIVGTKVRWSDQRSRLRSGFGGRAAISDQQKTDRGNGDSQKPTFSNFRPGKSNFLVIEACEYQDSFLHYSPHLIICPNVDVDHLDYFKTEENYVSAFGKFFANLAHSGFLIAPDTKRLQGLAKKIRGTFIPVRLGERDFSMGEKTFKYPEPQVPGRHNVTNAALALVAAKILDVPEALSYQTLNDFSGTWRRFEVKGKMNGATFIDDYAHHPVEIEATLRAAREWMGENAPLSPSEKTEAYHVKEGGENTQLPRLGRTRGVGGISGCLIVVYQPHQYSRTKFFLSEFGKSFRDADLVIVPDIYKCRDADEAVGVTELVAAINKNDTEAFDGKGLEHTAQWLMDNVKEGDLVITMGAGNIDGMYGKLKVRNSLL